VHNNRRKSSDEIKMLTKAVFPELTYFTAICTEGDWGI